MNGQKRLWIGLTTTVGLCAVAGLALAAQTPPAPAKAPSPSAAARLGGMGAIPSLGGGTATPKPAAANPKAGGIKASPHNLNNLGIAVEHQEVCRPCHAPHGTQSGKKDLWNHQTSSTATYRLYNAQHAVKKSPNYVGLDRTSKLCLSCHDGAIAVDNYGGKGGSHFMKDKKVIGRNGDLSQDHPIGVRYPGMTGSGVWSSTRGFNDPTSLVFSADGVSGAKGVQLVALPDGSKGIGCQSCHLAHDNTNGNFTRTSMQYSFLCLKCHDK